MTAVREVHADGYCVRLGLDRQVLQLDVPESHDAVRERHDPGIVGDHQHHARFLVGRQR
jgi:hypothetical protein